MSCAEVVMEKKYLSIRVSLICLAALSAPLKAQVPSDMPVDVRLWRTVGTPRVVDTPDVAVAAPAPTEARTISADLLRQPLSQKARQMLQKGQRAAIAGDHEG